MTRLFGKRAHVGGADVEEVLGVGRAVGESAAEMLRLLGQVHVNFGFCAEDLQREQRSAEARTHDGDVAFQPRPAALSAKAFASEVNTPGAPTPRRRVDSAASP